MTSASNFWPEATQRYRPEWENLVLAWLMAVQEKHQAQTAQHTEPMATEQAAYQTLMRYPFPLGKYLETIKEAGSLVILDQVAQELRSAARQLGWPSDHRCADVLVKVAVQSVQGRLGGL